MTTTIMFPRHSNSFGEPDEYARTFSAMSSGQASFFNSLNPPGAPESTNYDIQASQPQNPRQAPAHDWSLSRLPMAQPPSAQPAFVSQAHTNTTPTLSTSIDPVALLAPTFTPTNRPVRYYDSTSTISPSQSHFDTSSSASPVNLPIHPRQDSLYPKEDDTPSKRPATATTTTTTAMTTTRRRRNSEYVEPGSARAIYLEKNRRAASKCRSKQKQEQELLVERSRDFERKNRMLKVEVEMLQAEVRALKDLLGQHAHCSDQRIAQYLQMSANRLASARDCRRLF
jgi:cyclic AMP-dependent transcription factor ATF-2